MLLGIYIHTIECMPNHVHLFIKANPSITISYIVKNLKRYSSYKLRSIFPILQKYKLF